VWEAGNFGAGNIINTVSPFVYPLVNEVSNTYDGEYIIALMGLSGYNSSYCIKIDTTGSGATIKLTVLNGNAIVSSTDITYTITPNQNYESTGLCFAPGTPVMTDQGEIPIEKISADVNTINGKKIVGITKTRNAPNIMVCIGKDALGDNIPSQETVVSINHLVLYDGKMQKSIGLFNKLEKVRTINYSGIVYNVLMEEYDTITVNNMICETVHPDNRVAKAFMKNIKQEPIRCSAFQ